MVRSTIVRCACVLSLAFGMPFAAHAELKVGVVNFPRLLEESPQAKAVMQGLQQEKIARQKDLVAQQKDLQAKEEKLRRDGAVMSETERRNIERSLREGQRDLEAKSKNVFEDLNLRQNEEIGKLQRLLLQEIEAYARSSSYDLILGQGVLYWNETYDVTAQVLTSLQQRAKSGGNAAASAKPAAPAGK